MYTRITRTTRHWTPHVNTLPGALLVLLVLLVLVGCTSTAAPDPVVPPTAAPPTVAPVEAETGVQPPVEPEVVDVSIFTILATEAGIETPDSIPAGIVPIRFAAEETVPAGFLLGRLREGMSQDDLMGAMMEGGPLAALSTLSLLGGAMLGPGESRDAIFEIKPGDYVILNLAGEVPGLAGFPVTGEQVSSLAEPQAAVKVDMRDFAYNMPDELPAGRHIWEITNSGNQWHEFIVTRLEEGTTAADFHTMVQALSESDGPPSTEGMAFFWMPSDAGERAWVEVDLEAGSYGLACLLPDLAGEHDAHASHLDRGMLRLVTVK